MFFLHTKNAHQIPSGRNSLDKRLFVFLFSSLIAFTAHAQSTITGFIKDGKGSPIDGATISIKSSKGFAISDGRGRFVIQTPVRAPFTLLISSVGYLPVETEIKELKDSVLNFLLVDNSQLSEVVVTSRRRIESAQQVPIPISVVSGAQVENAGAFNVNRIKELVPSLQLYTSNPRNTGINIRGLGSPFGLTNDGLDPGVGFYVDGVYFARPAAATLDFIDIEQVEVLRGPQGTLFGKNTTSGAINISTRKPSFKTGANFEVSYGNYSFVQAKASLTGALTKKIAGRISFSGTNRNGVVENLRTGKFTNELNNLGVRGQLLFRPRERTTVTLAGDFSHQEPDGYAQVLAGVVQTKRPAFRQFDAIISDLNYQVPSRNAYDRKIDHDVPWNSGNDLGGVSLNIDQQIGSGKLTSTTAWRYWDWRPSNDRDFTGLEALAKSQNPSRHTNWSQELRYAGSISDRLSGVVGFFYMNQEIKTNGLEESGRHQWRFAQSSVNPLWRTPGLFEGFGIRTKSSIQSQSAAFFANVDWQVAKGLHVLPGIRLNYDDKDVVYDRVASGGLDTATFPGTAAQKATLQGFKNSVYTSQSYRAAADERNFTYQLTVAYRPNARVHAFATYSTSFKPVGVNVAGLPTINGQAAVDLAVIKPEKVRHYEFGVKSNPSDHFILNLVYHHTNIKDYQANVQSPELGVNRGYIANAEAVRVHGFELDANYRVKSILSFSGALTYTDGIYVKFENAPLPLEETGLTENGVQKAFKNVSGGRLPGISKWSGSLGGELTLPAVFLAKEAKFFAALEGFYRSEFSSSPSPSQYLNIPAYTLVNARLGYRVNGTGLSAFVWGRNLFNKNYYEQLLPAGGNAGHFAAVLGDPRTYGITLRYTL